MKIGLNANITNQDIGSCLAMSSLLLSNICWSIQLTLFESQGQ